MGHTACWLLPRDAAAAGPGQPGIEVLACLRGFGQFVQVTQGLCELPDASSRFAS